MYPMKFRSLNDPNYEIIVVSKQIWRIMEVPDMAYGDNQKDGQVYEYQYEALINGILSRLCEEEMDEALNEMKFVGFMSTKC